MWSDSQTNLELKVPEKFREIYDFKVLFEILQDEIDIFKENVLTFNKNLFITDADTSIISKYTRLLDISGDDDEDCRSKIITKINEIPPYSMDSVKGVIERHTNSQCEINSCENYVLDVTYRGGVELSDDTGVVSDMYKIIPANIAFNLHYDFIKFKDYLTKIYADLTQKTWYEVKLGA